MSHPKVSVIIPAYNRAHLIGLTLESVHRQTFKDYEIVVVDDGSTDNTAEVVARVAPDARYIRQDNEGIPRVLNRCVIETRGEYISFLGSDDALAPSTLAKQAALLDANPGVGIAHGPAWLMDEDGRLTYILKPAFASHSYIRSGREEIADLLMSNHIIAPTVMVRKQCFAECGLFDLRLGLYEDWNMWTRILKRWDIAYIHEPLSFYRVHGGEAGSIFKKADPRSIARFRRLHVESVLNDPEIAHHYRRLRGRVHASQHHAVAQRAYDAGDRPYAIWSAARSLTSNPTGVLGTTGRSSAKLLARSLAPRFVIGAARSIKNRGRKPAAIDRRDERPNIEAIIAGAAVPQG